MSDAPQAVAHLSKAQEFLDAASSAQDAGQHSAAASSAVIAAINAKDAICIALTGRTGKSEDHRVATVELRAAGPSGAECASDLDRLLRIKSRVQYQSVETSSADGARAVERARRVVAAAEVLLLGR